MSPHVSLNLLNELRQKRDKILGKPRIVSLFINSFNKFNNTGTRMFNRLYLTMILKLL